MLGSKKDVQNYWGKMMHSKTREEGEDEKEQKRSRGSAKLMRYIFASIPLQGIAFEETGLTQAKWQEVL